jgi:hypothetical protein
MASIRKVEAEFPVTGLWDVHGKLRAEARYAKGVVRTVGSGFPNGVRFEGDGVHRPGVRR